MHNNISVADFLEYEMIPKWNAKYPHKPMTANHWITKLRSGAHLAQHEWNNIGTIISGSYYLLGMTCKHVLDYCIQQARCSAALDKIPRLVQY